jgi:hypothetical protein
MLGLPARLHALESVGKAVGVDDERDPRRRSAIRISHDPR